MSWYFATVLLLAVLGAILYSYLHGDSPSGLRSFRQVLAGLLDPGDLLREDGQTAGFYLYAVVFTAIGTVLPVVLLGAFVFRLFNHDPITWRKSLSIEDIAGQGPVAQVRMYNSTRLPLVEVRVRVYARIRSTGVPAQVTLRRLRVLATGGRAEESIWGYAARAVPFTVKVPLSPPAGGVESAGDGFDEGLVDLQGRVVELSRVTILVVATGVFLDTGNTFTSNKIFRLDRAAFVGHFQDIEVDYDTLRKPRQWQGWKNFEGNQDLFIFYPDAVGSATWLDSLLGSFASRSSTSDAVCAGWQALIPEQRTSSEGMSAGSALRLGLRSIPDGSCQGKVRRVSGANLSLVDSELPQFERVDVSGSVVWEGMPREARVFAFQASSALEG